MAQLQQPPEPPLLINRNLACAICLVVGTSQICLRFFPTALPVSDLFCVLTHALHQLLADQRMCRQSFRKKYFDN
jgi:hypothetical protein